MVRRRSAKPVFFRGFESHSRLFIKVVGVRHRKLLQSFLNWSVTNYDYFLRCKIMEVGDALNVSVVVQIHPAQLIAR